MGKNDDRMDPVQIAIFVGLLIFVGVLYVVNQVIESSELALAITIVIIGVVSLALLYVFREQVVKYLGPALKPYFSGQQKPQRNQRKSLTKSERMHVWKNYNGESFSGACYSCGREVTVESFEVGHNIALAKGGKNTYDNYRPICSLCNKSMGTRSIEEYKKFFEDSNSPNVKTEDEVPKTTKKELVNTLTKPQMRKIIRELELEYDEEWDGDERDDYREFLMRSRKASIEKIQKIVGEKR